MPGTCDLRSALAAYDEAREAFYALPYDSPPEEYMALLCALPPLSDAVIEAARRAAAAPDAGAEPADDDVVREDPPTADFTSALSGALGSALDVAPNPANHYALLAGISEKHLSRIRRGHQLGTPEVLTEIADALGCRWSVRLLRGEDLVGVGADAKSPEVLAALTRLAAADHGGQP